MHSWHKLVVTGVLAVILLLPFMPMLALCVPQSADSMQCPADCPMMAGTESRHSSMEMKADDSGSCCTIRSSAPVPVTTPTVVSTVASVEPTTVISVPLVTPAASHHATIADSSPPPFFGSQAQLCTFLI